MAQEPTITGPPARPWVRLARIVVLAALTLAVGYSLFLIVMAIGFGESESEWRVENQTGTEINLYSVSRPPHEVFFGIVPPGGWTTVGLSCRASLVARDQEGNLVATWDGSEGCSNHDPWVITG